MNDNRRQFLDRLQWALQRKTTHGHAEVPYADLPEPIVSDAALDILSLLAKRCQEANIQLACVADETAAGEAIQTIVSQTQAEWENQDAVIAWHHPLLEKLDLQKNVEELGVTFFGLETDQTGSVSKEDRDAFRRKLIESKIGITSADYCIADTSTLVLRNRAGQPSAVSLVPSVHVAVIFASQVLSDFVALYIRMEQELQSDSEALTHRMTFISGPSKTGDIELVMVHGAHGPRALHLIVIDDLNSKPI